MLLLPVIFLLCAPRFSLRALIAAAILIGAMMSIDRLGLDRGFIAVELCHCH